MVSGFTRGSHSEIGVFKQFRFTDDDPLSRRRLEEVRWIHRFVFVENRCKSSVDHGWKKYTIGLYVYNRITFLHLERKIVLMGISMDSKGRKPACKDDMDLP